jgi:hypothetical protein
MSGLGIFLALITNIICAGAATRVAAERHRSSRVWLWLSALFGPVALAIVVLLPPKNYEQHVHGI